LIEAEQKLTEAVNSNTAATRLANSAAASEMLTGYANYDKSDYKGYIASIVGDNIISHEWQNGNTYISRLQNDGKDEAGRDYRDVYWEQYKK
jgi:hypothetical protein